MKEVYITGHRNPDMDTVCSAYAYAQLKRILDPEHDYRPIICGHLSESLSKQLDTIGFTPQPYMRDVHPRVSDVMHHPDVVIDADSPIYNLVNVYSMKQPSVVPVTENGAFYGLLSVDDITRWFLKDNSTAVPVYDFSVKNIASVLPGKVVHMGESERISASLLAGAAALDEFKSFVQPGMSSIVVMGVRHDHIEYALKMQVPAIIITTSADLSGYDFSQYKGLVYVTRLGTAETLRRLRMAAPVKSIMGRQGERLQKTDLFDDAKEMLTASSLRGLPVFDGEEWAGYVTRRCFLEKPQYNVIMMDHNEESQSIRGIAEANILEVIDHHRVDAPKTNTPILFDVEPLGSTCTIVHQLYLRNGLIPDTMTAKVLLTGIICDTLILKSPTTTSIDVTSAEQLASMCGVRDIAAFGHELFSHSESLSAREPDKVINSDFKIYSQNGVKIGVGQCEVPFLTDLNDYSGKYLAALDAMAKAGGFGWVMLMVTDVMKGNSVLLSSDKAKYERKLSYVALGEHVYDMPGVLSRKKQLLPEILHAVG
ncbi:MAG: putative manganese-dependent inorganic diphosphatase [Spirochaetales bacterium]|nr:putative manganese-dependent inorganic diphosphatase [Spirochaetales bacterium]